MDNGALTAGQFTGADNNKYRIEDGDDDFYFIVNKGAGTCLFDDGNNEMYPASQYGKAKQAAKQNEDRFKFSFVPTN